MDTRQTSTGFYFKTLSGILGNPGQFFSELSRETKIWHSLIFLIVSGFIFTCSSLMNIEDNHLVTGLILFANAVGMVFISSGIGYMIMVMTAGRHSDFKRFFSIYALSSGVTLLASWIPFFLVITEPWKWWLIGTGLTKNIGLKWTQALIIIGLSIFVIVMFFYSANLLFISHNN
ncbi:Yip1 domain-containing protein [Desulfonema limicola]|uniref:Yip1 domain-containing protein n=1 Tax=Desulfonema limicola TaxID=45656 RepID=A0A975BCV1_9BACT|nr:YIP1 family protein [Desulfonema limicola]QTA83027.1 Yip1 domain-containing protein [Desulfonema limicola]